MRADAAIDHFHLDNGLEVVVIPTGGPRGDHMIYFRNGAADDPPANPALPFS